MKCPAIIKYAYVVKVSQHRLPPIFRNMIIGALGGGVTGGMAATVNEWGKYHKKYPDKSFTHFLKVIPTKSKTRIGEGYRLGSQLGSMAGLGSVFINFKRIKPGKGRIFRGIRYPAGDAFNILGLDKAAIKRKSEIGVAFRRVIKMVHPDKGGTPGLSKSVKDAYDSIKKTDWYSKLAFLRR